MADITQLKGFVSKPATKSGSNGDFSVFTLAYGVKNKKTEKWDNFFFNVTDFKNATPPEDGSRVEVSGWFKPRYYEKNGVKHVSLDVQANEVKDLSGGNGSPANFSPPGVGGPVKDPWEEEGTTDVL